jgi:hypothetical protein
VLFRHRRKCSLVVQGAQREPVEDESHAEQHTSLRAKARSNTRPYQVPRTYDDPGASDNTWDDINTHLFTLPVDSRDGSENQNSYGPSPSGSSSNSASISTPGSLPKLLDPQIAINPKSYVNLVHPVYNYNVYYTSQPSLHARDASDTLGAWNDFRYSPVAMQSWGGGGIYPPDCNPFVIEPKLALIENNNYRERCGPQHLEPDSTF